MGPASRVNTPWEAKGSQMLQHRGLDQLESTDSPHEQLLDGEQGNKSTKTSYKKKKEKRTNKPAR
jgi:hypothetical protein